MKPVTPCTVHRHLRIPHPQVAHFAHHHEVSHGFRLMNEIINEGRTWPFDEEFADETAYRAYFLSHDAFVVRALDHGLDSDHAASAKGDVLGAFYIKPNFPGRCSHICNGGFITDVRFRQRGVGRLMGAAFLALARDLGYSASYFNLVFASNKASLALWESLGFARVATLPRAAQLEGVQGLDTAYGYHYDLARLPGDFDPAAVAEGRADTPISTP